LRLGSFRNNKACLQETTPGQIRVHKELEKTPLRIQLDPRAQQTLIPRPLTHMALKVNNLNLHIARLVAKASMCKV
jgi:hypothetical protein